MNAKAQMDALFMIISSSIVEGKPDVFLQAGWDNLRTYASSLESRIAELEHDLSNKEIEYTDLWDDMLEMQARIAELEEFKMIVEGCGFEVITEPPVLNHPERKILKGHGIIYVPELPEPPEVK